MGEGNADLHFLEAYRRVEIFLRGVYGGKGGDGVERYLEQMRTKGMPTARGSAYANLRYWRQLRNEFVHVRSGVCTEEDVAAMDEFYAKLLCAEDPMTGAAGHHSRETAQPAANIPPPVIQQPSAAAPPQAADGVSPCETSAQQKPSRPAVRRAVRPKSGRHTAWAVFFRVPRGDGRSDAAVRARILPHTLSHSYR